MSDETNLSGMSLDDAREYVMGYLTSVKQLDLDIARLRAEADTWQGRATLAEGKGMADLAAAATNALAEARGKLTALEAEREELRAKVARMREQLPILKATERSVDADRLLAELQLATGELLNPGAAAAEAELRQVGADAALEELKRKVAGGS